MASDPAVRRTREFFAPRAETWDERFPDDAPAFARAAAELGLAAGGSVLDVGCGTGRALAPLRAVVGAGGTVVGIDVTPEMLATAQVHGRSRDGALVLGDTRSVPLADATLDAIFAAGLITHVPDPVATLQELARVSRAGGRLAIFHPIGRAALAQRHGRELRPDELLDPKVLPGVLADAGWEHAEIDDADDRYRALATRA